MPRLCLALLLFWLACPSWALTPAPLDSDDLRLSLGPYTGYYEDVDGTLSVEQVRALDDDAFRKPGGEHANLGKNASVWWFKARLVNALDHELGGYLEVNYPLLDHLQVHLIGPDGTHLEQESGDSFAFSQRPVQVRNFWFPMQLEPGVNTLLIRVETSSTVFVPLFFATYGASAAAQENLMGFNGAFYGVLFAMFCYNLFLYLSLRESAYLWYLAYNLNVGLLAACFDGMLFKLLPEHVAFQSVSIYILMYLHCLTAIQFSRHFLHARQYFPRLDTGLRLLMLICVGCLLSVPLIGFAAWNILASVTVSLVSLILLLTGIYVWRRGVRYGSYYTLAWAILLFAFIQATTGSLGLEVFGVFGATVVKIGVTIELITLHRSCRPYQPAQGRRLPIAPCGRASRLREPGQEPFFGQDEPRDPHSAQRRAGHAAAAARNASGSQPALLRRHHFQLRQFVDGGDQRHPRLRPHRIRQAQPGADRVRSRRHDFRDAQPVHRPSPG